MEPVKAPAAPPVPMRARRCADANRRPPGTAPADACAAGNRTLTYSIPAMSGTRMLLR